MPSLPQIVRLSKWLYIGATAAIVLLPLAVLWGLFAGWSDPHLLAAQFPNLPPDTALTPVKTAIVAAIGALMLPPALMVLIEMRGLFRRYIAGEILTSPCAAHIRRIGKLLVALAALGVAIPTAQILALTADNPLGQRSLAIGISSDSIGFMLAGGLLIVIGWAMAEAVHAAEENASFV